MKKKKKSKKVRARVMINGKIKTKSFETKSKAIAWEEKMRSKRSKMKQSEDGILPDITVKEICQEFLETRVATKQGTKDTYKSTVKNWIIPYMGSQFITDLRKSDGIKLVGKMEELKKAPSTINKTLTILKCVTKFAVENEYLKACPFGTIKKLKVDNRDFKYFTGEEIVSFLSKIKEEHLFDLITFAFNTGLRRGEICGLQWKNVKITPNGMELHFNEQLLPGKIRDLVKGHSYRFVPLTLAAQSILESKEQGSENEYIFKMKDGSPIDPNYLSSKFRRIQKSLGIKEPIKLHGTRHSFASILTVKGVNLQKVQHLLGHKDSKITERYSHLNQEDLRKTIEQVGEIA